MLTTESPLANTEGILVKLIDFGLACMKSEAKGFVGTPEFLSPELAKVARQPIERKTFVDSNCKPKDVYALGIVFYEVLSNTIPYDGDNSQVIDAILRKSYEIPRSISSYYPEMIPLINSMLSLEEKRYDIDRVLSFIGKLREKENVSTKNCFGFRFVGDCMIRLPKFKV